MKIKYGIPGKMALLILLQILFFVPTIQAVDEYVPAGKNSVKTTVPLTAKSDASQLNPDSCLVGIEYTDGLGRPNVSVQKAITSGEKKDLVSVTNYDCFGRVSNQWLPAPMTGTSIPDANAVMQQAKSFYGDNMPYATIYRTTDYGTETNQICKPGEAWHTGNKTLKIELGSSSDNYPDLTIKRYQVNDNSVELIENRQISMSDFNAKITKTTDEDGNVVYTFRDAWGRTLMQRRIDFGVNHDTYYVYDEMGRLRFVLSPEASSRMSTPGTYSLGSEINGANDPLAQYAYVYNYDEQGRCIAKKLPGRDWLKMMYDVAGHLIFSQDGNQRTIGQWTYYKYDVQDRLIQSGTTILSDTDISYIQTTYNQAAYIETYINGTGYTANCRLGTNTVLLIQNFYDSYDFLNLSAYSAYKGFLSYSTTSPIGYDMKYSNLVDGVDIATKGMLTGTAVAMLDNSVTIVTSMYYDDKGRIVRSLTRNALKGWDREYYNYSFTGKLLRKLHLHTTSFNISNSSVVYSCKYDFADRLTDIWHKSNNRTDSVNLCSLKYDDLGHPIKKILHGGLHAIDYTYNIQGWLKSINSPRFSETLYYQDGQSGSPNYFNGSIGAVSWGTGAIKDKKYDFYYDGLHRMMRASYSPDGKYNEEIGEYDKNGNINVLIRSGCYDYSSDGSSIQEGYLIDWIFNAYSGNQLLKSMDSPDDQNVVLANNDFKDDDNTREVEYLYDKNGNMIANSNKGIAWIKYNILNLPEKIQFVNGNKIEYVYDAIGVKHKAKYTTALNPLQIPIGQFSMENPSGNVLKKDSVEYSAGYIYMNRKLDKVLTPEGYMQTNGVYNNWDYWKYCYLLKDHQGNTRVNLFSDYVTNHSTTSYTASGQIDYYPFGMEITPPAGVNSGKNPYLYSGKEMDRMHGLNQYDFSARWMDNAVPGFNTPDPLAEYHFSESPYSYCGADPVNRVDPTGMDYYSNGDKVFYWKDKYQYVIYKHERYDNVGETFAYTNGNGHLMYGDENGNWSDLGPASLPHAANITESWDDYWYNKERSRNLDNYGFHPPVYSESDESDSESQGGDKTFQNINTGLGASGIGLGAKELMIQGAVAQSRGVSLAQAGKSSISQIRALGSSGASYLKAVSRINKIAAGAGAALTILDGVANGFQAHHVADLGIQGAIYGISASVPVAGWVVGGAYFLGDMYFQSTHDGQSITQYYLDN